MAMDAVVRIRMEAAMEVNRTLRVMPRALENTGRWCRRGLQDSGRMIPWVPYGFRLYHDYGEDRSGGGAPLY